MNNNWLTILEKKLPSINFLKDEPLSQYTTVKIGGPADLFCQLKKRNDLISLIKIAQKQQIPLTVLGFGSNSLIADRGIRGLVIRNLVSGVSLIKDKISEDEINSQQNSLFRASTRWKKIDDQTKEKHQLKHNQSRANKNLVLVEVEAGTPLSALINQLHSLDIVGLEPFSRIPGTIGGGVVNNIHGRDTYLGQFVDSALVINEKGKQFWLKADELEFDYDYSRFHHTKEIIIALRLILNRGNVEQAKKISLIWAKEKAHQPQRTLGCVFQNLTPEEQKLINSPTPSAGYLIDKLLGMKGWQVGDAKISEKHAAFIENLGQASAHDYLTLIKKIQTKAREQLAIQLRPEIFFLGFTQDELSGIIR